MEFHPRAAGAEANSVQLEELTVSERSDERRSPDGIRTRVTGLKGQRPRPLDDGAR